MSSLNSSSSMADKVSDFLDIQQEEETVSDSFICCVCLDMLYKPIVLECGHVSCFWCVHKSMDAVHESHCPICRHPYHHFPTICEMLHFLLSKMYPLAYRRREKQTFEEEMRKDCFSPQLDCKKLNNNNGFRSNMATTSCITSVDKDSSKMESNGSNPDSIDAGKAIEMISSNDFLCGACKQLLYRPVALNCGHVYCEVCVAVAEEGIIICKVCECPHPSDCPNVCLEFNNFLEERFPKEYASRRESVKQIEAWFQHKNPSSGTAKKGYFMPFRGSEDFIPWWNEHGSKVHAGAGCDYCGMYPIVGDRYKCQDCVELIGFDLCGDCYNTQSKRPGRFNQQHTSDHRFELVKQPDVFRNIMLRLVGGHRVDNSVEPVLAISAMEDPPDGWISVETVVDTPGNLHNIAAASDGTANGIMLHSSDTQGMSVELEFRDSPEVSGIDLNDLSSLSRRDHNGDQYGNSDGSPS